MKKYTFYGRIEEESVEGRTYQKCSVFIEGRSLFSILTQVIKAWYNMQRWKREDAEKLDEIRSEMQGPDGLPPY